MPSCAVVGATGFTGIQLVKILVKHPEIKIQSLTSRQTDPPALQSLIPEISEKSDLRIETFADKKVRKADVVFLCLPHSQSAELGKTLFSRGQIVIDLTADFRLPNAALYQAWYQWKHPHPELLKKRVYGLPELFREKIAKADLIANPGCYPTGAILGLLPLLKGKLIAPESVIVDSKSGTSGAGKKLADGMLFYNIQNNFKAYRVEDHQHTPEIKFVLEQASGASLGLRFVPHLLPVFRGLLSTIHCRLAPGKTEESVRKAFETFAAKEPFIRFHAKGSYPSLHDVTGTNLCSIGAHVDAKQGFVTVITAIDNLIKGASGQAVQNMNIRLGFSENMALEA